MVNKTNNIKSILALNIVP